MISIDNQTSDFLDIKQIIVNVVSRWQFIGACGIIAAIFTGCYAFLIAKPEYISTAQLLPAKNPNSDQFSAAAAFIGSKSSTGDVELFEGILSSRRVARNFLFTKVIDSSTKSEIPLYRLFDVDTAKPAILDNAMDRVINSIDIDLGSKGGPNIISVSFTAEHAWLAKSAGDALISTTLAEFASIKNMRYSANVANLNKAVQETYREWLDVSTRLASFKDNNRSISTPSQYLELSKFEIEKMSKEQTYLQAKKEFEDLNLGLMKSSVPVIIIDPMNLPSGRSKPKRKQIIILGFLVGVFLSSTFFAIKMGDKKL